MRKRPRIEMAAQMYEETDAALRDMQQAALIRSWSVPVIDESAGAAVYLLTCRRRVDWVERRDSRL